MLMSNNSFLQVSLYVQHWCLGASALHQASIQLLAMAQPSMQAYNANEVIVRQVHTALNKKTMMEFAIEKGRPPMDPETKKLLKQLFVAWSFLINPLVKAIAFCDIPVPQQPAMPVAMPAAMPAADEGPEENTNDEGEIATQTIPIP